MCVYTGKPSPATAKSMTFDSFLYDADDNGRVISSLASIEQNSLKAKVLCIWGGNSSGKTHLLHAIQNSCKRATAKYLTSDQFCIELACAFADNRVHEFVDSFNEVDILLLDDAQFLVGKYALDFLKERIVPRIHMNILLASDCDPYVTGILKENEIALRLASPNAIVRLEIIHKKAAELQLQLEEPLQQFIVANMTDVRRIDGFLTFLKAKKENSLKCP